MAKRINKIQEFLDEKDIDFIIRIISIMKEEYVKVNTNLE